MARTDAEKQSFVSRALSFFVGCREELAKTSKPTRQETVQATLVTVFIVVFVSIVLAILDVLFNWLMKQLL